MANLLYPKYKERILGAGVNLTTGTIRAALVDTGVYTYNAAHDALDDLTGIIGAAQALTAITTLDGVMDAGDVTYASVAAGGDAEAIVLYKDTGTPATSYLIAYIDTATGLPVTPNGGDITITWPAAGIFSI